LKKIVFMSFAIKENDISWRQHPFVSDVKIKTLLTKRDHAADMTTLIVNIPKGINVPEHIHQKEDDNLYILSGKGKMWIENIGEIDLHQGVFIRARA
jgi:quercetin dioxygenase-like cupin family protein